MSLHVYIRHPRKVIKMSKLENNVAQSESVLEDYNLTKKKIFDVYISDLIFGVSRVTILLLLA